MKYSQGWEKEFTSLIYESEKVPFDVLARHQGDVGGGVIPGEWGPWPPTFGQQLFS